MVIYHYHAPDVTPDSKVHGANIGSTWVLSAPDGPHVGPMNFAIRDMHVTAFLAPLPLLHSIIMNWNWYQLRGSSNTDGYIDGLVQESRNSKALMQEIRNSSALAMEWRLFCTNPSIWPIVVSNLDLIFDSINKIK